MREPEYRFAPAFFGRYSGLEHLGDGGLAHVFKATQKGTGKRCVAKIPRYDREVDFRSAINHEAQLLLELDHPNIPGIVELIEGNSPVLVREYVEGRTITQLVNENFPFNEDNLCALGTDLYQAVIHAHSRAILHRDITPANVILNHQGGHLYDFGNGDRAGGSRPVFPNPPFTSPEMYGEDPLVLLGADFYAIAATLAVTALRLTPAQCRGYDFRRLDSDLQSRGFSSNFTEGLVGALSNEPRYRGDHLARALTSQRLGGLVCLRPSTSQSQP